MFFLHPNFRRLLVYVAIVALALPSQAVCPCCCGCSGAWKTGDGAAVTGCCSCLCNAAATETLTKNCPCTCRCMMRCQARLVRTKSRFDPTEKDEFAKLTTFCGALPRTADGHLQKRLARLFGGTTAPRRCAVLCRYLL